MKFTAEYPALVTGTPQGARVAKTLIVIRTAEFSIESPSADDAPPAFAVHRDGNLKTDIEDWLIRSFDGKLYRSTGKRVDDFVSEFRSREFFQFNSDPKSAAARLRDAVFGAENVAVLPSGIVSATRSNNMTVGGALADAARSLGGTAKFDREAEADLERWRLDHQRELDNLILVDGEVYEFSGEPFFVVGASGFEVMYSGRMAGRPRTADCSTYSAAAAQDAYMERDAMIAAGQERHYLARLSRNCSIKILDPDHLAWNGPEMDFDRFAREVCDRIAERLRNHGERHDLSLFKRVPRQVFDTWLDLRDCLESYDPLSSHVPDDIEPLLRRAWETFRRYDERLEHPETAILASIADETFERLFARWEKRPIRADDVWSPGCAP